MAVDSSEASVAERVDLRRPAARAYSAEEGE